MKTPIHGRTKTGRHHGGMDTDSQEVSFTEFLHNPDPVAQLTAHGPVRMTRPDGEDLVLFSATQWQADRNGMLCAAAIMGAAVDDSEAPFTVRLRTPFQWMVFLSEDEQVAFSAELVDTCLACAEVGQFGPLSRVVSQWAGTAAAYSVGMKADGEELDWLDVNTSVPRPT